MNVNGRSGLSTEGHHLEEKNWSSSGGSIESAATEGLVGVTLIARMVSKRNQQHGVGKMPGRDFKYSETSSHLNETSGRMGLHGWRGKGIVETNQLTPSVSERVLSAR